VIKKSGKDNTDPKNYGTISLLLYNSKIFEKIIHSRLINHLNATDSILHFQFGFKQEFLNRLTIIALTLKNLIKLLKP